MTHAVLPGTVPKYLLELYNKTESKRRAEEKKESHEEIICTYSLS